MKSIVLKVILPVVLVLVAWGAWSLWPHILMYALGEQQRLYSAFNRLMLSVSEHQWHAGITLVGLSFLYGIFHAVGPGHGKVVISSYLASSRQQLRTGIVITMAGALLQGLFAVAIVSLLRFVFEHTAREVNRQASEIIHFNSLLVGALGLWLCWQALKALRRRQSDFQQLKPVETAPASVSPASASAPLSLQPAHTGKLGAECSCGHVHTVTSEQLKQKHGWRERLMVIVTIGARPCSGALMVLMFGAIMQIYWVGVVAALIMALGTGMTTSALAILTVTSRRLVLRLYPHFKPHPLLAQIPRLAAGVLLIVVAALLFHFQLQGSTPFYLKR